MTSEKDRSVDGSAAFRDLPFATATAARLRAGAASARACERRPPRFSRASFRFRARLRTDLPPRFFFDAMSSPPAR